MKSYYLLLMCLLLPVFLVGCGEDEAEPFPLAEIVWEEAEVLDDGNGQMINPFQDINTDGIYGNTSEIDDFFGIEDDDWGLDDFELGISPVAADDFDDIPFDYGTPLELGNEIPLETGVTLETGTDEFEPILPVFEDLDDVLVTYVPLEVADDIAAHVEEELERVPEDLPKTNDLVTGLGITILITCLILLLFVIVKQKRVGV